KADILVEVSVSDFRDPKRGYIYRLRAFDIHSGTVLISTNSSTWPLSRRTKGEWVASSEGYVRLDYPEAVKVGGWLATDLMAGLSKQL
ncbi:MAG: hypothetical protein GY851_36225, partial [bacterium]|nr:hypothetical protein [bacterium]